MKETSFAKMLAFIIIFIIFWDFLMFYQIFHSPQVKPSLINKFDLINIVYMSELHELHGIFADGGGGKVPTQEKKNNLKVH